MMNQRPPNPIEIDLGVAARRGRRRIFLATWILGTLVMLALAPFLLLGESPAVRDPLGLLLLGIAAPLLLAAFIAYGRDALRA